MLKNYIKAKIFRIVCPCQKTVLLSSVDRFIKNKLKLINSKIKCFCFVSPWKNYFENIIKNYYSFSAVIPILFYYLVINRLFKYLELSKYKSIVYSYLHIILSFKVINILFYYLQLSTYFIISSYQHILLSPVINIFYYLQLSTYFIISSYQHIILLFTVINIFYYLQLSTYYFIVYSYQHILLFTVINILFHLQLLAINKYTTNFFF